MFKNNFKENNFMVKIEKRYLNDINESQIW